VTDETTAAPGWYADPMRRYDHRYYNGRSWTADVAREGQRFVDQLGIATSTGPGPVGPGGFADTAAGPPRGSNPMATAAMVLGIIALTIAWMPLVVVLGLVAAVLAIVFGIIGLRRARTTGAGRSFALAGLVTAAAALAAAAIGIHLTMVVLDEYDAYLSPEPHQVEVSSCELRGARAFMTGELTNSGTRTADYSVLVGFLRPGTDNRDRTVRVAIADVPAGSAQEFEAQAQSSLDEIDCVILEVNGPLPFGLALD
jgi:hypothetical protein